MVLDDPCYHPRSGTTGPAVSLGPILPMYYIFQCATHLLCVPHPCKSRSHCVQSSDHLLSPPFSAHTHLFIHSLFTYWTASFMHRYCCLESILCIEGRMALWAGRAPQRSWAVVPEQASVLPHPLISFMARRAGPDPFHVQHQLGCFYIILLAVLQGPCCISWV